MEANFRHERLDVEVIRLVPYASVQFAQDTPLRLEAGGIPVDAARFQRRVRRWRGKRRSLRPSRSRTSAS